VHRVSARRHRDRARVFSISRASFNHNISPSQASCPAPRIPSQRGWHPLILQPISITGEKLPPPWEASDGRELSAGEKQEIALFQPQHIFKLERDRRRKEYEQRLLELKAEYETVDEESQNDIYYPFAEFRYVFRSPTLSWTSC
jgi:hypothetical protein